MVPTNKLNKIRTRSDRTQYSGRMNNLQVEGSKHKGQRYATYEKGLNQQQKLLLKQALYGLSIYSPEELKNMHYKEKKKIRRVYEKTSTVINMLRQVVVNRWTNNLFKKHFPQSPVTAGLRKMTFVDEKFQCNLDLAGVGITDKRIIKLLIRCELLPANFHDIKGTKQVNKSQDANKIHRKRNSGAATLPGNSSRGGVVKTDDAPRQRADGNQGQRKRAPEDHQKRGTDRQKTGRQKRKRISRNQSTSGPKLA